MRTTLDLPEALLEEARRLLGFKSKTDAVILSLTELVRRRRIDELKSLAGKIHLELDLPASRSRPGIEGTRRKKASSGRPRRKRR